MVAPEADCIQLVALWAAQTVACFLLHAAWCCGAVVLRAASGADGDSSSSLCVRPPKHKQDPSKALSAWLPPLQQHIAMCVLQQQHHQRLALPMQQQLQHQQLLAELDTLTSKAGPLSHFLVSAPKPQGPNMWLPALTQPQAGDSAPGSGPAPAPSNASTQGTGRSGAPGQSSSSASGSSSAQGSQHTSGQNSLPPAGGAGDGDDSDDGGDDKRRLAHQLAKSHSLETPDPLIAGTNTASLIQAAVDRAQRGLPAATAAESAPAAADRLAAGGSTPAAATAATGPLRLPSPFAAAAGMQQPMAAASSQCPAAAARAHVSPFAAVQPEALSTEPASVAAQQPAPAGGVTRPQRLPSPFAAVSGSASPVASALPGASSSPRVGAAGRTPKPGSPAAVRPAQQPRAVYSPFAAAQPGATYTSPFGSSSSSTGGSGSSGSRQAAATAAAAYAASRASKGSSSTVGSRGPAAASAAAATTGPWRLQSPFAAAPVPAFSATSMQLDAVAEEEPLDVTGSPAGQSQLRPTQQSVDAVVAAAAAAREQQRQRQQQRTSPVHSAFSSGHSSYSSLGSRPPTPSAAQAGTGGSRRSPAAGSSSPGGIRSPFAAAAAVAAATDAASTPRGTPKTSPTGSASGRAAARASRKGSAAGSRPGQVSSMAHSVSLSSLMQPGGVGGSSVLSGSTTDQTVPPRDTSSGSIATLGTKFSSGQGLGGSSSFGRGSGSTGSLGAGAGTSTPPAADDAAAAPTAAALSAQEEEQQQPPMRSPPSARPSQQQLVLQTAVQAPFAAASGAGRAAPAASGAVLQQVTFRPTALPIAVSSAAGALMPPVLMAMPPTPQQMAAAVSYQAAQAGSVPSLIAAPDGRGFAAASSPAVLVPQYALPVSAALLAPPAGTGLISVPLSAGMPAVLVHPSLLSVLQSPAGSVTAAPSAAGRQPAARASPFAAAQPAPSVSPAASSTASVPRVAAASAAGSAISGTSAVPAPKLGCMCVAPACLAEGAASQVQVYVLGLEGTRVQQGHTYKVAAFMGTNLVAEAKRECKGGERLLRISLPALPKGVVQLLVVDGFNKPCFMQHLLVLPPPCAQDLNTLWSQVLRGQILVTPPTTSDASGTAAAAAAARTPGASLYGSSDSSKGAGTSSSSVTSAAPALSAVSAAASQQQAAGQQAKRLGPLEIQDLWRHSYSRVLTDIAAVLLTRSKSTELPAGSASTGLSARAAAAAAARAAAAVAGISPRTNFDTPEMRDKVGALLHFFATHSKWAVVELLTTHVYGYGSSAKAMFTSKLLPAVQPVGLGAAAASSAASPVAAAAAAVAGTRATPAAAPPQAAAASPAGSPAAAAPAAAGAASMQWLQPPSIGEIQPETDEQPGSGGSGHSFSFADVRTIFQQRPLAESRSLAPASSSATATARSGGGEFAPIAETAAAPHVGRAAGERGLSKVLQVKRVLKRAFSGKP